MTLYEYRCKSCGDQIVTNVRLEKPEEQTHDGECGPLKRTWSVGFQIKSTDWGH